MEELYSIIDDLMDFAEFSRFDRRYTESYCKGCGLYHQDIFKPFPHKPDCSWLRLLERIKGVKDARNPNID